MSRLVAIVLFALAGCATTAGMDQQPAANDPNVYYGGNYQSWGGRGVNSGGTYSVSGWRFSDGKLRYEIREYGGRRR